MMKTDASPVSSVPSCPDGACGMLLAWFSQNARTMPWREEPTPYRVWLSEIMLQQTRIEAAMPYYLRFVRELPDVAALASVEDETLMKLWQGLGYYSRARNLKKTAQILMRDFGGQLPADARILRTLPGIGDYTAGAIASIAFGLPEPAVDGNVLRVYMRLVACADDVMAQKTRRSVAENLRKSYPSGADAGRLTQAWMELGETVCVPNGVPKCGLCPLRDFCCAFRCGQPERYPVRSSAKERRQEEKTVFLLCCDGKFALCRRPENGLLAGLWEFPNTDGHLDGADVRRWALSQGMTVLDVDSVGKSRHIFSHVEWHMTGWLIRCAACTENYTWATTAQIRGEYAVTTAFRAWENRAERIAGQA